MRKSLFSMNSCVFGDPQGRPNTIQPKPNLPKHRTFSNRRTIDFRNEENPLPLLIPSEEITDSIESQPETPGHRLRHILESTDRTDEEAWTVYESLKHLKFFGQFLKENNDTNVDSFLHVCKKLEYETHPSGTVIMNQGDFSNGKVYIVLSGELFVYIKKLGSPMQTVIPSQPLTPSRGSPSKAASLILEEPNTGDMSPATGNKGVGNYNFTSEAQVARKSMRRDSRFNTFNLPNDIKGYMSEKDDDNQSQKDTSLHMFETPETTKATKMLRPEMTRKGSLALTIYPSDSESQKGVRSEARKMSEAILSHNDIKDSLKLSKKPSQVFDSLENIMGILYGTLVNKIHEGSYFGEKALFSKHRRNATIVASTNVELLTLKQEDFKDLQVEFNKAKLLTIQFLRDIFPNIETVHAPTVLENLIYNCEIKVFPYKKKITVEGEAGEEFFVVFEGQCEFSKTVIYDKSHNLDFPASERKQLFGLTRTKKDTIVTSNVDRGSFIGEEILFNEKATYEYTVKATTERVRLISFKKSKFTFRCPKKITEGLRNLYELKKERNHHLFQEKLQLKNGPNVTPRLSFQSQDGGKKIVSLEKINPNNIQVQTPPLNLNTNKNKPKGFRLSLRMDSASLENSSLLLSPVGRQGNNFKISDLGSVRSFRELPAFSNHPESATSIQDLYEKDNANQLRVRTEASHLFTSQSFRPLTSSKTFITNTSALFSPNSNEKSMRPSPIKIERELSQLTNSMLSSPTSPQKHRLNLKTATSSKRISVDGLEDERIFEPVKEKNLTSPLARHRVMSSWAAERKGLHDFEMKEKPINLDFISLLNSTKKSVIKRKQKDHRVFNKSSVEMTWKMADSAASIISFGTPRVTPNPSLKLPNSHKKLTSIFNSSFERSQALLRHKSKKKTIKAKGLNGTLQVNGISKQERSKSMHSAMIDMNLQFNASMR